MTYLEKIEQKLQDERVLVLKEDLTERSFDAVTIKTNNITGIILDDREYKPLEYGYILGHEKAHIDTDSFYKFSSTSKRRRSCEYKAMKHQVLEAGLNPEDIKKDLENGLQAWEIADKYNVYEQLIIDAIEVFKVKYWNKEEI